MSKFDISKMWTTVKAVAINHSPGILLGAGISGMVATTIWAVKVTPEALRRIEEFKRRSKKKKLTMADTVKASWKCYIPPFLTGAASIGCLLGGSHISTRRTAALATAYSLSETAMKEYKDKVVETIGEKKEQNIREAIAKEHIRQNPPNQMVVLSGGDVLCYDNISKRYFKSSVEKLKRAANQINYRLRDEMYVSLNDFYDEIDSPSLKPIKIGDDIGWNIDKGYLELTFTYAGGDEEPFLDQPCLVVDYTVVPDYNYH